MNVLVVLIPCSLGLGLLALALFLWTLRSDQYDDPEGAAARILIDDDNREDEAVRGQTACQPPSADERPTASTSR